MKIGIMFGCFIPLHSGHMGLINRSLKENDKTIIGVCGKDSDRGKDFIPFRERLNLMRQKYQNDNIIVVPVDDEKLKLDGTFTLDNWVKWGNELFRNANINPFDPNIQFTWYTGEPHYKEKLGDIYTTHNIILIDRAENKISGTQIRNNVSAYENEIAPEFLKYINERKIKNGT